MQLTSFSLCTDRSCSTLLLTIYLEIILFTHLIRLSDYSICLNKKNNYCKTKQYLQESEFMNGIKLELTEIPI